MYVVMNTIAACCINITLHCTCEDVFIGAEPTHPYHANTYTHAHTTRTHARTHTTRTPTRMHARCIMRAHTHAHYSLQRAKTANSLRFIFLYIELLHSGTTSQKHRKKFRISIYQRILFNTRCTNIITTV